MRDAFGGAFMIKIFIVFIIVYVFLTAMALNYAKAFKVKNMVIEYLENNEITDIDKMSASAYSAMGNYFEKEILTDGRINYRSSCTCKSVEPLPNRSTCSDSNGIVIVTTKPEASERNKLGTYHTVTTCFGWDIYFVRVIGALGSNNSGGNTSFGTWKISGQTRPIVSQ